jgi:hypothetical protein
MNIATKLRFYITDWLECSYNLFVTWKKNLLFHSSETFKRRLFSTQMDIFFFSFYYILIIY